MLEQLQQAYGQGLKNLVFIDFANKSPKEMEKSIEELELDKERACCEDLLTAIHWHLSEGDYESVKERLAALAKSAEYMESLEEKVKAHRRNQLYAIANNLRGQGWSAKVVKSNANKN